MLLFAQIAALECTKRWAESRRAFRVREVVTLVGLAKHLLKVVSLAQQGNILRRGARRRS